ncbi:hypothetical protein MiSe_86190 [Microseira wollei NIES-4236]|uniref:Uncharacterized protein n=1 Tax=Microseira wollei NIES-4236 TaxID=2530354 RepID=A0AAV3XM94_9CYAN|nr:hypothetical protein MiSe_86190 [Microseira wollei NIES-4236]
MVNSRATSSAIGIGDAANSLSNVKVRSLSHRHRSRSAFRWRLAAIRRCRVENVTAGVDVSLSHGVGTCISPGFVHIQFAIAVEVATCAGEIADAWVADSYTRQGLVAVVIYNDAVVNYIKSGIDCGCTICYGRCLGDVEVGSLSYRHRGRGAFRAGLAGIPCGDVLDDPISTTVAINVGLGDGVSGTVSPGFGSIQGAVAVGVPTDIGGIGDAVAFDLVCHRHAS